MKKTTLSILLAFFFTITFTITNAQTTATYSVVFESTWSQETHPHSSGNLPSGAHWSKLVGATHNGQITFWELNGIASPGIENVAELGSNSVFFDEINAEIAANNANNLIDGPNLGTAAGEMAVTIETTANYPFLTLVSMIAPSPDWMMAVNSVELTDPFGEWQESIVLDVYPIDAGTDSGTDYTSPNEDTNPKENISSLQGIPPFSNEKIGTLTVTLESILDITEVNTPRLSLFPNPTQGEVTISHSNTIKVIDVYDVLGKKVLTAQAQNSNTYTLHMQSLSNGVYLVQITDTHNNQIVKKVVKQ